MPETPRMTMDQWVELQLETISKNGDGEFQLSELVDKALEDFGNQPQFLEDMVRAGVEAHIVRVIDEQFAKNPREGFIPNPLEGKRRWNS
jgi:hypothetical protein